MAIGINLAHHLPEGRVYVCVCVWGGGGGGGGWTLNDTDADWCPHSIHKRRGHCGTEKVHGNV